MAKLKPPKELCFEGNAAENWRTFAQYTDLYMTATGLSKKDEEEQVESWLILAGNEAQDIYKSFGLTGDDAKKVSKLKEKFKEHCEGQKIWQLSATFF